MRRIWLGGVAASVLSACSGNPFIVDEGGTTTPDIPVLISSDLDSITYDPVNERLIVSGISLDDGISPTEYTRKPGLDRGGYEAYTFQDDALDRHVTAYVKAIDGTRAAIVVSGGQFGRYFGGGTYSRDGAFDPPSGGTNGGLVTYAGNYVGILNTAGDGGDLLPVDPGTAPEVIPDQAAEVTGSIFINADFADNLVNGTIYDRTAVDVPGAIPTDQELLLIAGDISTNGFFTGAVEEIDTADPNDTRTEVGTYGGIFGGTDASAVAGSLFVSDHLGPDSEEFGLFVLSQCGQPGDDPICSQVNP